jgi:hypothetical protein
MPKISKRDVRALEREVKQSRKRLSEYEGNHIKMTKKIKSMRNTHVNEILKLKNDKNILEMNVRKLYEMFLKQQKVIRQQQSDLLENCKRNPHLAETDSNLDCAKTMISMSQQVCSECLGTRTILKTKKNIRYSAECKSCK